MNRITALSMLIAAALLASTSFVSTADPIRSNPQENQRIQNWITTSFQADKSGQAASDLFIGDGIPFSFVYNKTASAKLIPQWKHDSESKTCGDYTEITSRWSDAQTGLLVTAVAKSYKNYPAVEWVLYFQNCGKVDTPILENVQAADLSLRTGTGIGVLHSLKGDGAWYPGHDSFRPIDTMLYKGDSYRMAPAGGRSSSDTAFPFFNYEYDGNGLIMAVGWTGQWAATIEHSDDGSTRMRAGMENTHLLLHPGEKIRTPRILILKWEKDRMKGHNQFRRLMLDHYSPKPNGGNISLPFALQTYDRYSTRPDWATEAGQLKAARAANELGCDAYWLDAAWFPGGYNHVGSWVVDSTRFPNGLKPVSDECHKLGMKFVLWFEPERVADDSQIDREHPEWVIRQPKTWGLFDLGIPEARRWLTDLLSKRIDEYGVDIYRNDFNLSPLPYWKQKDTPDREGMSEIRYIEGLYEMWDELLARHPGLEMDNCASGGRRIDIEMAQRSVPLWRSDSGCWHCPVEWHQEQSLGLSLYVPLHTVGIQESDGYAFRSGATGGAACELGYLGSSFRKDLAKQAIAEAKENSKYWYGDLYPLTNCNIDTDHLMAFQLHREDLDAGMILAFRRQDCNTEGLVVKLQGIDRTRKYRVETVDEERKSTVRSVSGKELAEDGFVIRLEKHTSLLVRYKALPGAK